MGVTGHLYRLLLLLVCLNEVACLSTWFGFEGFISCFFSIVSCSETRPRPAPAPPASSVPSHGCLGHSGGLPVRSGGGLPVRSGGEAPHCTVCSAPPGGTLFVEEGEAAPRKPWGVQCGLHIQATGAGSSATMAREPLIEQLLHSFPREHSHQMCPLLYLIFFKIIIKQYSHILQFWKIKGKMSFCFLHKWLLCMQSLTVPVVNT